MNRFKILKNFDYDVYDAIKIIKIINKKSYIKIRYLQQKHISIFKISFLSITLNENVCILYRLLIK